jgi:colicin import membrane protein
MIKMVFLVALMFVAPFTLAQREVSERVVPIAGNKFLSTSDSDNSIDFKYAARIKKKIKSNTIFIENGVHPGNPTARFAICLGQSGDVMSVEIIKGSGIPEYDRALEIAIIKSSPLPKKDDGTVERDFVIDFALRNRP